ncbi:MAG: hypothetical protein GEU97_22985 [Actinophytocola sp.]|nr:hypothetical protein [Actinophytocola sp.]
MATPLHLNTTVNGSIGMCENAAERLRACSTFARDAADSYTSARNTANAGWGGPAAQAFHRAADPLVDPSDGLADLCQGYADALLDFAGSLQKVVDDMEQVLGRATAGDLEVQGPIVMRPDNPGAGPHVPLDVLRNGEASAAWESYRQAASAYATKVADYNAKVAVFNECLAVFKRARQDEEQAHTELWEKLGPDKGWDVDGWTIGSTAASSVVGLIAGAENTRHRYLIGLERMRTVSTVFQHLAVGRLLANFTGAQRTRFFAAAAKAGVAEETYRKRIAQLDKFLKHVPKDVRTKVSAYPGKGDSKIAYPRAFDTMSHKAGSAVLRKLPYVGSITVAGQEVYGAYAGEQSWGKAVASTAATLGGGALGGSAGAFACAPIAPPWGSLVCGLAGGGLGGFAGGEVVDFYVPDEEVDMPEEAEPIDYRSVGGR